MAPIFPLALRRSAVAVAVLCALTALCPGRGFAQEDSPEDYLDVEFPRVLHDLRRAEIILAGSFPFSLFVTLEVFDFYRYASNDWAQAYAPWPFRSPSSAAYTNRDKTVVLASALSVSAVLAIADYVVGKIIERRAKNPPPRRR